MTGESELYRRPPVRPALGPDESIESILRDIHAQYGPHTLHVAVGRVALRLTRDQLARRLPADYPGEPAARSRGMYASFLATASGRRRFESAIADAEDILHKQLEKRGLTFEDMQAVCRTSPVIRQIAVALDVWLDPHCEDCDAPLPQYRRGRPRRYCSDSCRRRAWRTRQQIASSLTPPDLVPDWSGRERAFEPLLDELLLVFCPGWKLPSFMEGEDQHERCDFKRFCIGHAARQNPDTVRQHADLLLRGALNDHLRGGIWALVDPLVETLDNRPVQQAIIEYVRSGTQAEKVGATSAWHFASPQPVYRGLAAWRHREPTTESQAAVDATADLLDQYRAACLTAFLAEEDPDVRHDLSLGFTLAPADYPNELQLSLQKARHIITADPQRYRRILITASSLRSHTS